MDEQQLIEFLKANLSLDVVTKSEYTGGDPLYQNFHSVQLCLGGEVISEIYLD